MLTCTKHCGGFCRISLENAQDYKLFQMITYLLVQLLANLRK